MKKLIDVYNIDTGVLYQLYDLGYLDFMSEILNDITYVYNLEYDYLYNHSGEKYITPLFNRLLELYNVEAYDRLANIINIRYVDNWKKIYNSYFKTDYKPLENYSMIEKENQSTDITTTDNVNNNAYGFDSVNPVGVTQNVTTNNVSGASDDNERVLTRSGNIGVTTSQQMLESELELRKYDFFKMMFKDIDKVLCLEVYG